MVRVLEVQKWVSLEFNHKSQPQGTIRFHPMLFFSYIAVVEISEYLKTTTVPLLINWFKSSLNSQDIFDCVKFQSHLGTN